MLLTVPRLTCRAECFRERADHVWEGVGLAAGPRHVRQRRPQSQQQGEQEHRLAAGHRQNNEELPGHSDTHTGAHLFHT